MEHKAHISSGYRMRLLLVGVMCAAFGGWFLYDGYVGYPDKNVHIQEQNDAWQKLVENEGNLEAYKELAIEKRWWSPDNPEYEQDPPRPQAEIYSPSSILAQKILGSLCGVVGLFFLGVWVTSGGRWVALADGKLCTNKGLEVALDDIETIDSARWKTKGIALVHFQASSGRQTILLDDWKFEVKPMRDIYKIVHEHVDGPDEDEKTSDDDNEVDDAAETTTIDTQA